MPSSKGKPTDPKKREEAHKEVLQMEKGGGKGQWSAWKAAEMAKRYEAKGGGYEETGKNPNEAKKGDPKPKKSAIEKGERKAPEAKVGTTKKQSASDAKKDEKKTKSSTTKSQTKAPAKKSSSTTKKGTAAASQKKASTRSSSKKVAAAA